MVANAKDFDAIVIMAKRPGRREGPRELEARAALGVLFWQSICIPVSIVCVEGRDLPDSNLSGAEVVHDVAVRAGVPNNCVVTRSLTNCTVREMVAIRGVLAELGACHPLVITHPYHVRRTGWYLRESGIVATVVGCSVALANRKFPAPESSLLRLIERGEARGLSYAREFVVEILLTILHALNHSGRVEMLLADRIRGRGENETG
jgi:uncharacterized SAM-binding protein YcdF (DUF218 family)